MFFFLKSSYIKKKPSFFVFMLKQTKFLLQSQYTSTFVEDGESILQWALGRPWQYYGNEIDVLDQLYLDGFVQIHEAYSFFLYLFLEKVFVAYLIYTKSQCHRYDGYVEIYYSRLIQRWYANMNMNMNMNIIIAIVNCDPSMYVAPCDNDNLTLH